MLLSLKGLKLKNFKGLPSFTFHPGGADALISGSNETGKTTIVDAFNWLLFGKDSNGAANFQLKPVDGEGNERHNLDTEVEVTLDIDGTTLVLMRRFKEKYTKKRGESRKSFTGHTTDFFIDEVPAKEKEFIAEVARIIDIETFKLVTNPYEFNNLPWLKRRDILFEMCGDANDGDVVETLFPAITDKDKANTLINIVNGCGVDDHKKKVKAKQTDINNELKQIPVRVDEHSSLINDTPPPDPKKISIREGQIEEQQKKLSKLQTNEQLSSKQTSLNEVNSKISKATGNAQDQANEKKKPINKAIDALTSEYRDISNQIKVLQNDITLDKKRNKTTTNALEQLRKEWKTIKAENPVIKTDCPYCDQPLPEDKVDSAREKFNQDNAKQLEENQTEGKRLKQVSESMEAMIEKATEKADELSAQLPSIEKQGVEKKKELKDVYIPVDVKGLNKEKDILESEISGMENGTSIQEKGCLEKISEINGEIKELRAQEATYQASKDSRSRIVDLEAQEKTLAAAYEDLESELFLIEQFTVRKVEMVENQVNGAFKMATFKLFKIQINGGIEPCCETLHNGVPYNHGLNNAARINVGLDIISTLSEYYEFKAPIFIDNSESVNEIIPMDTQVISLAVSTDKKLVIS